MAEVRITITAKDGTQQVFKAVEDGAKSAFSNLDNAATSSTSKTKSAFDGIKASWVAVTAAITAAVATVVAVIKNLIDQAALAARVETLGVVLNVVGRNAGNSAREMEGYADGVKKMGITTQESLSSVTRMTEAHMDLTKASQLARIAQDAAVIGEKNSSQALAMMVQGIQSGEVEVLRGIGINVNFEQSYEKLAQKLGKSTEALTEQEKVTARTNVVLEAGKNIAGTYSASMDTVGKQALSLSRHSEEARLKLGELFKPAYAALIETATNILTGFNEKLAEMNRSGDLAKWGEAGASAFTFLAQNAIPLALGSLGLMMSTVVSLVSKFEVLQKVSAAAFSSPNLLVLAGTAAAVGGNALGQYFTSLKPEGRAEKDRNDWEKENKDYLKERWEVTRKQLDESGIKGMLSPKALSDAMKAGDVVKSKVKVGEAIDLETGSIGDVFETRVKDVRNELQKTKEQIDATTKGFASMASVIDQMGGMSLKIGSGELNRQLSDNMLDMRALTVEYQKLSDSMKMGLELDRDIGKVNMMTQAYGDYGNTIEAVYENQASLQRDILEEMKLYETKQSNIAKQAVNVTETEIKGLEAKLGNYRSYYSELQKMQKVYYDAAVKAAADLVKIEKNAATDRRQGQLALQDAWNKANPAANDTEAFQRQMSQLEERTSYAGTLTGEDRIRELQSIRQTLVDMSKTITSTETQRQLVIPDGLGKSAEFADVQVTKLFNTFEVTGPRIQEINEAIARSYEQQAAETQAAGTKAVSALAAVTEAMKNVEASIQATETTLKKLDDLLTHQRVLTIDTTGAMTGLRQIVDQIIFISGYTMQTLLGGSPPVASETGRPQGSLSSNEFVWENSSLNPGPNEEPGVAYYGNTGYARGTSEAGPAPQRGGVSLTIAPGAIVINGANKSPQELAAEIVKPLSKELSKLGYLSS